MDRRRERTCIWRNILVRRKIGISTGYREIFWGDWFTATQLGGSENLALQLARQFALLGHDTTLRLPYDRDEFSWENVRVVGQSAVAQRYDYLFAFDDYAPADVGRTLLVACRSDPPVHTKFDEMVFLSAQMAAYLGHPGRPHIGGGVDLDAYAEERDRYPRRVICCSSPDRCPRAAVIGRDFDFVHSYKPVPGYDTVQLARNELVALQQTAQVMVYPLEPSRPSDFFSMSVLECLAAGTPVVVSDADSMAELWSDAAIVLPNPVRLSQWSKEVEWLLGDRVRWQHYSDLGRKKAADYTWTRQAARYLAIAEE